MNISHVHWSKYLSVHLFRTFIIFGLIFWLGYHLRALHPEYYPLGFDQIQILQNAQQIHQGHFVLLGPRTGPAPMYTGPLIYYVAAFLLNFTSAPNVLVPTSLFLFTVTFLVTVLLSKKYLKNEVTQWLMAALLAFSPYQIFLDRTPWNPNISFLAAILVFLPLLPSAAKKLSLVDYICVMVGCFLGYQAHFSGLLLPLFSVISWFIWYRRQWWLPLLSFFSTLASLIPTALFDYRHHYLNLKGFLFILQQRGVYPGQSIAWWQRVFKDVLVVVENTGKISAFTAPYYILMTLGFLVFILFITQYRKRQSQFWWPIIWVFSLNLVLFFYQGPKPEYYFLLQFPALFYMTALVVHPLLKNSIFALFLIGGVGLYAYFSTTYQLQKAPSLSIGNQVEATQKVREYQRETDSLIVYDMEELNTQGMRYLLPDLKSGSATTSTQTTHLVYPYNNDSPVSNVYGKLAVWQDPRTDLQKNYLVRKQVIVVSPLTTVFLESHYHQLIVDAADAEYMVENNRASVAQLFFIDDKQSNQTYNTFMNDLMEQFDRAQKKWQQVKLNGERAFVRPATGTTMIMIFTDNKMKLEDQEDFLKRIEIISYAQ